MKTDISINSGGNNDKAVYFLNVILSVKDPSIFQLKWIKILTWAQLNLTVELDLEFGFTFKNEWDFSSVPTNLVFFSSRRAFIFDIFCISNSLTNILKALLSQEVYSGGEWSKTAQKLVINGESSFGSFDSFTRSHCVYRSTQAAFICKKSETGYKHKFKCAFFHTTIDEVIKIEMGFLLILFSAMQKILTGW